MNATLKIQAVYDALSENFIGFDLTPYRRNDRTASPDILSVLESGGLVLRNFGYFCIPVLRKIENRNAFFFTRCPYKLNRYDPQDRSKIDLLSTLNKFGSPDTAVLAGTREKMPVRLVAVKVPSRVAGERRRRLRQNRNGSMNPTRGHPALLDREIFLTNVPSSVWSSETVSSICGISRRIEIIFKGWKQHFNPEKITDVSLYQPEILMYSKLLFITLFQVCIFSPQSCAVKNASGKDLIFLKMTGFFSRNMFLIVIVLSSPGGGEPVESQIIKHCTYDRRTRLNCQEILTALCLSWRICAPARERSRGRSGVPNGWINHKAGSRCGIFEIP